MKIELKNIGKRFHQEWIFRHISFDITSGVTAIVGPNGSGKSTLIQLLSAAESPTEGSLNYIDTNNTSLSKDKIYKEISYAAPYIDLPENLTANEILEFQKKFKPLIKKQSNAEFLKLIGLSQTTNKLIKHFSSGMKQRLKLGLTIGASSRILLLDEPCSNLDDEGVEIYHRLLNEFEMDRVIIIGSNQNPRELYRVNSTLSIPEFKS